MAAQLCKYTKKFTELSKKKKKERKERKCKFKKIGEEECFLLVALLSLPTSHPPAGGW